MKYKYLFEEDISQYNVESFETNNDPKIHYIENGTILPAKRNRNKIWGLGGVLDENDVFVNESKLDENFGGKYDYSKEKVILDESVLFLGVFPNHWGHFLIDVVCKLWCVEELPYNIKIAYVGEDWVDVGGLNKLYLDALELVGIKSDRLIYIDKPMRFKRILIPDRTLGFKYSWHSRYKAIIEKMVINASIMEMQKGARTYEKIYFTRTKFKEAKKKEVGEIIIEDFFKDNGYKVISPETLSVAEQIYLFNNCKEFACVSGTLAHNSLFAQKDAHIIIFNRTSEACPPQLRIDQLTGLNTTYIDAFYRRELNKRAGYNAKDNRIVHIFDINENVKSFAKDNNMVLSIPSNVVRIKNHLTWLILSSRQILAFIKYELFR